MLSLLPTLAPTVRDNGELNGVVFIDIRKAFDSINHNILLRKMKEQFGISNIELKLFESYLSDREHVSFVNGAMSAPKRIVCGVPQGSILGPLLFLLIIIIIITSLFKLVKNRSANKY